MPGAENAVVIDAGVPRGSHAALCAYHPRSRATRRNGYPDPTHEY